MHYPNAEMQNCIQECMNCHLSCMSTVSHCLEQGGMHAERDHIVLMLDCAEICQTSANFMMRASNLHGLTCAACAEVCTRCAEDCERMSDDPVMQMCANTCRNCAASCRQMALIVH